MTAAPLPALFVGHGNPMNALADNPWTRAWRSIGEALPRPRAILAVSAHWYVGGTRVTTAKRPRTIHDFGGFPPELTAVQYPAPGDPGLAREIEGLLAPIAVAGDEAWGLDHGTWSVLCHLVPDASVPVVQMSIDRAAPADLHREVGRRLGPLRDSGVLVLGSGNLVHNLQTYAWGRHPVEPYDWATRFEDRVRNLLVARDHDPLVAYAALGPEAALAVPTPEHYLPLLHVIGLVRPGDAIGFPVEGMDGGSVSMLGVQVG